MKVNLAIALALLFLAPSVHADSGTLQVAGTSTFTFYGSPGQPTETITASYTLLNGVLVPGSAELQASGIVSFANATVVTGRTQCGVGWVDALGDFVGTDFYEDNACLTTGQPQDGSLGLFFMNCVACGDSNFGVGFAHVTDLPMNTPEPSSLLFLATGLVALALAHRSFAGFRRSYGYIHDHRRFHR